MQRFCEAAIDCDSLQIFLQREPERALRLLTTSAVGFQGNMARPIEDLLRQEYHHVAADPPLATPDLAYVILRTCESFV